MDGRSLGKVRRSRELIKAALLTFKGRNVYVSDFFRDPVTYATIVGV
jgi:hypothetical protein